MSELRLTSVEQSLLATFCAIAREVKDRFDRCDEEPDFEKLGERIASLIVENNLKSQDFGKMYDKLHRTGANSLLPSNRVAIAVEKLREHGCVNEVRTDPQGDGNEELAGWFLDQTYLGKDPVHAIHVVEG